jgi:hypothetical protein
VLLLAVAAAAVATAVVVVTGVRTDGCGCCDRCADSQCDVALMLLTCSAPASTCVFSRMHFLTVNNLMSDDVTIGVQVLALALRS